MGGMSMFGGGWAYKFFGSYQNLDATITTGPAQDYGAWQRFGLPLDVPTIDSRWMHLFFHGNSAGPVDYQFQFAVGEAGLQVLFPNPTAFLDFFYVFFPAVGTLPGGQTMQYQLPITMPPGQKFWARGRQGAPGVATAIVGCMLYG